jgi:uncharacterized protein YqjF (DUF2071 family)
MRWLDLLFLHWTVTPSVLRPHVPGRLTIDTFESSAWLGVVPFLMSGVRPRFALAVMRQPLQHAEVDVSRTPSWTG